MNALDNVVEVSQKLESLKRRLGELDQERTSIDAEIARLLSQLGELTGGYRRPADQASLRERILWVLNKYREQMAIAPADIARELNLDRLEEANARGILSRLVREGHVRRYAHGRYILAGK